MEEQSMRTTSGFCSSLAAAVLIVVASAGIGAAQTGTDTCAGLNATIGGTCTPLTNATSGSNGNTAFGGDALESNTTGGGNTAIGRQALQSNTEGEGDVAIGDAALSLNTTGSGNTATGGDVLGSNTTGSGNTATGVNTLSLNTTGFANTATGENALTNNTTGLFNTATGANALSSNTTGSHNTAIGSGLTGEGPLGANTTGQENIAIGTSALANNSTGGSNIAIGASAGVNLTTGDNNIDIDNAGVSAEADTIRIGTQGTQTATFVAGVFGGPSIKKGCSVVADSTGMLGCSKSSVRYKRDIRDMGDASDKLMKLRPVTFRYKSDSTGIPQYGLIAEEVEKVYPELVIDGSDGKAETVEYQVLPAMLLNEVQKQSRQLAQKDAQIAAMQRQLAALQKKDKEIDAMAERLDALERQARVSRPERLAAALR
jgi:hypothetical protein